jgi:hypothetical protein
MAHQFLGRRERVPSPMAASTPSATIRPQSSSVVSLVCHAKRLQRGPFPERPTRRRFDRAHKMATNKPPLILRKRLSCLAKSGRACCIACQHRAESGSRAAPNERGSSVGSSAIQAGCLSDTSPHRLGLDGDLPHVHAKGRASISELLEPSASALSRRPSALPLAWPKRGPRPRFDRRHRELQAELMAADWLQKLGLEHCLPLAKSFG